MFKFNKLVLMDLENTKYTYLFSDGINYFQGKNDSGKTEFYKFIDFMLGSSYDLRDARWYDNLSSSSLYMNFKNAEYRLTRTKNPEINYFSYANEDDGMEINSEEYKEKIMSVFSPKEEYLRQLREFLNEDVTYRTFTLFNFLGEKRQGIINDFFDKCSEMKYSIRVSSILNFIFNNHLEKIKQLKDELTELDTDVKKMEKNLESNQFIIKRVNTIISELGIVKKFNGNNHFEIQELLYKIIKMEEKPSKDKTNIAKLELYYNTLTEQIKEYDKIMQDSKQIENDNSNRILLVENLHELIKEKPNYEYLIEPIMDTLDELGNSISFSKYVRQDDVIKKLKEQREDVKKEIIRQNSKFKAYRFEEKTEKIVILKDLLLQENKKVDQEKLESKRKRIRDIKKELLLLQNYEDTKKINEISDLMTELYMASSEVSTISEIDFNNEGFRLEYVKKGNSIQGVIDNREDNTKSTYYIGSMARHTLMQLCGYLAFLIIMIKEERYPLVPVLVLDHISKQFDSDNGRAIGLILEKVYEYIEKSELQIFIFDDESAQDLNVVADHEESLLKPGKSGFIPFYHTVD